MMTTLPVTQDDITSSWLGQIPVGQVVVFGVIVCVFLGMLLALWRKLRPLENFFKDWNGEEARPGVAARPGVMPRLSSIESHIADAPSRPEFDRLATSMEDLAGQVKENTVVIDLVRPFITVDLPKDKT